MRNTQIFFIFGNHPALSAAEIIKKLSLQEDDIVVVSDEFMVLDADTRHIACLRDCTQLQKELGGVVKIGSVMGEDFDEITNILKNEQKKYSSKFHFGLSVYGKKMEERALWTMGKEIKDSLRGHGSVRFVRAQKGQILSSVAVEKNGLLEGKGIELCLLHYQKRIFIGKTIAVQDFEGLSLRDYGRPCRDDYSGMIPPKLAQMMINISGAPKDALFYDPFCGSGTIVQEALLMGYKYVTGSDISEKAVNDCKRNIAWLKHEFGFDGDANIFLADARHASTQSSVGVIITEPYLGKQRGRGNTRQEIVTLERLYKETLQNFSRLLIKDGIVVMIWPVFVEREKKYFLFENEYYNVALRHGAGLQVVDVLPPQIKNIFTNIFKNHLSSRGNFIYGRPGQGVMREIVVLKPYLLNKK